MVVLPRVTDVFTPVILNWFANNINGYSLSQNGWDRRALGSPCPLNVGVQDLVIEPR